MVSVYFITLPIYNLLKVYTNLAIDLGGPTLLPDLEANSCSEAVSSCIESERPCQAQHTTVTFKVNTENRERTVCFLFIKGC